jgi:hypothetical protein
MRGKLSLSKMAEKVKRPRLDITDKNFDFLSDEKVRNINFNLGISTCWLYKILCSPLL